MKNLISALQTQARKDIARKKQDVKTVDLDYILSHWAFNDYLTPARRKAAKEGRMNLTQVRAFIVQRYTDNRNKRLAREIEKVENVAASKDVDQINISVEWTKSRTWGMCPKATARVMYTDGTAEEFTGDRSSGCGYDKESAAIASALNQSGGVLKVLFAEKNRPKNKGNSSHAALGYGSGYGILPAFEGGVGVSSHRAIFEKRKFSWETVASGKTFDVYRVSK